MHLVLAASRPCGQTAWQGLVHSDDGGFLAIGIEKTFGHRGGPLGEFQGALDGATVAWMRMNKPPSPGA